jgi:hypothetical protein
MGILPRAQKYPGLFNWEGNGLCQRNKAKAVAAGAMPRAFFNLPIVLRNSSYFGYELHGLFSPSLLQSPRAQANARNNLPRGQKYFCPTLGYGQQYIQ